MHTWKFTYWFDDTEWFEWETDVSEEEYALIQESISKGEALNEVSKLDSIIWRVCDEIRDSYNDESDDDIEDDDFDEFDEDEDMCEGLTVKFQDPNDPFYDVK